MATSVNSPPTGLLPMELPLTRSAGVSRARTFLPQARERVFSESVLAYGTSLAVSLANYDPVSCSWRTSQSCLIMEWETFSDRFPRSGMMRNGTAFQLPTLAPLTSEIGSGLLPTPRKSRGYTNPTEGKERNDCVVTALLGRIALGHRPKPAFVEWKMGYPIGWTATQRSEMP